MLNSPNFLTAISSLDPVWKDHTFLLALSGGSDSMALAHLFKNIGAKFQIAHVNYKLRNIESEKDQQVVENFCTKHNINFHLREIADSEKPLNRSIQIWARELRYDYFKDVLKRQGLDFIVTAHHLNDQLETFIINLTRGTGLKGLCGIPAARENILRPLLNFTKDDIYLYVRTEGIEFREDLSNQKNTYLRNRVRNKIIPELVNLSTHFYQSFTETINILNQHQNFIDEHATQVLRDITLESGARHIVFDRAKFDSQHSLLQREILLKLGFPESVEHQKIINAESGSIFSNKEIILVKESAHYTYYHRSIENTAPVQTWEAQVIDGKIVVPDAVLNESLELGSCQWTIDLKKSHTPLMFRRIQASDRIFPIGMSGSKNATKFLKDKKIPILARSKYWVLIDQKEQIIGIVPLQQDRRFLALESSEAVALQITPKNED